MNDKMQHNDEPVRLEHDWIVKTCMKVSIAFIVVGVLLIVFSFMK